MYFHFPSLFCLIPCLPPFISHVYIHFSDLLLFNFHVYSPSPFTFISTFLLLFKFTFTLHHILHLLPLFYFCLISCLLSISISHLGVKSRSINTDSTCISSSSALTHPRNKVVIAWLSRPSNQKVLDIRRLLSG